MNFQNFNDKQSEQTFAKCAIVDDVSDEVRETNFGLVGLEATKNETRLSVSGRPHISRKFFASLTKARMRMTDDSVQYGQFDNLRRSRLS